MIAYYLIVFPFVLTSFICFDRKFDHIFRGTTALWAMFFIILTGFRYDSIDYFGYQEIYARTNFTDFSFPFFNAYGGTTGNEFIYALVTSIFKSIGLNFEFFVFFIAALSVTIKFYIFKKYSQLFLLSLLIYISFFWTKDLGQMRNGLAAAFILLSIVFIYRQKPVKFYLTILLAAGVQVFAILALPLYAIHNSRYKQSIIIGGLVLSLVLTQTGGLASFAVSLLEPFSSPLTSKVLGYYTRQHEISIVNPFGMGNILRFTIILGIFIFLKDQLKRNPFTDASLTVFSYGVILYTLLFSVSTFAHRSTEAFSLLTLAILLPFVVHSMPKHLKIPTLLLSVTYCLYFMHNSFLQNEPYKTIFFK